MAISAEAETPQDRKAEGAAPEGSAEAGVAAERPPSAPPQAAPGGAVKAGKAGARVRRRGPFSSLTRRILAVNVLALAILVVGVLYLDQYRQGLIRAELEALTTQGEIFAGALGEGAVAIPPDGRPLLLPGLARQMMRRLVAPTETRARLFDDDGFLVADSWVLAGPGGLVLVEELPAPGLGGNIAAFLGDLYDWMFNLLPRRRDYPPYSETADQKAADYDEADAALWGEIGTAVRSTSGGGLILSVAVPVQRYKQIVGAILLSTSDADIQEALRSVRLDIFRAFLLALGVTVLLSIFLAGTIARPVRRLALAAEKVTHGHGRKATIPDFADRGDEIGDLSGALRDMTAALWQRMDAIERFAADVAHEIKNPLTSLRSAVETAARVEDPERQRRLMAIILEDVQRLDRLISDISNASRLDAELSRAELTPVDLVGMLTMLSDLYRSTADEHAPRVEVDLPEGVDLLVPGMEGRLVQVFRNLIDNAVSFSPPGGKIAFRVERAAGFVTVTVDDEGPGIPEGMCEAIFKRFYTERPAQEKFGTHSGLGLSISRQIIEAHDGSVTAENRRDERGAILGARFVVRLPTH
ncbi:MAG: sensor histidine kinase [Alphaproteobacteria bacterium]